MHAQVMPDLFPPLLPSQNTNGGSFQPGMDLRQAQSWLIRLRWFAIAGVSVVIAAAAYTLRPVPPWWPLYVVVGAMGVYNLGFVWLGHTHVSPHTLVLSQILLDLVALTALLYYAGGIANPFALFFVFHVILTSILLPARESYAVAGIACALFLGLTLGEAVGGLPHLILGVAPHWHVDADTFPLPILGIYSYSAFVIMTFGATYLTVTIASRLRQKDVQVQRLLAYNQGLLDHLSEKICVIGADYRLHFANELVGVHPLTAPSQPCYAVLWGETGVCPECPLPEVLAHGESLTRTRQDVHGRVFEQVFSLLPIPDGPPEVIESCRDVTAQAAMQKELVLSEKLAAVGELAAGLAHDIGNPLDGCQHALELLRRRLPSTPQAQPILDLLHQGLRRIDQILRRFLIIARQDSIHQQRVDLSEIIDAALGLVEHRIAGRRITVDRSVPVDLPPLNADADALCHVLTNLLLNAAEAIDGPGRIGIAAQPAGHPDQPCIEIRLADSGGGIPPENRERIFEPFFTTKPEGQGTGLGLALVRRFIRAHGGDISVQSNVGMGSVFVMTLPLSDHPEALEEGSIR